MRSARPTFFPVAIVPAAEGREPAGVRVGTLRAAVALRAEEGSGRAVASEIGIAPNAVKYFLNGGEPRPSTRRKLERWYARWAAERGSRAPDEQGWAALQVLTGDLPPTHRTAALIETVECLERNYAAATLDPPTWLRVARARLTEKHGTDRT